MLKRIQTAETIDALLTGLDYLGPETSAIRITGLRLDSRQVEPGNVFIALAGKAVNGEDYIDAAVKQGAVAIVVDQDSPRFTTNDELNSVAVPVLKVRDLAENLGQIGANYFSDSSKCFSLIGVTGTNGKSTVVSLMGQMLYQSSLRAGVIGTVGYGFFGETLTDTGMTTPDAILLQGIMHQFAQQEADAVCMEVSSHGIDQQRIKGLDFAVAVITNVTRDHLDYHGSFEKYCAVKKQLFLQSNTERCVINLDCDVAKSWIDEFRALGKQVVSFSTRDPGADVFASAGARSLAGTTFSLKTPWGVGEWQTPLVGEFNLSNLLAAISGLCALGLSFGDLQECVEHVQPVAGRMQRVGPMADTLPAVFVDYAHTPDALERVLSVFSGQTEGRLWVVFGCGGDRDKGKRPQMAKVAESIADYLVITNDNPRNENPQSIVSDILEGLAKPKAATVVGDRMAAIDFAITQASVKDCVVIAGKGHEKYQLVQGQKLNFDDVQVATSVLEKRLSG